MRTILILAVFGALLLQPAVIFADANADCRSNCANEKASRDISCPSGEDNALERDQCMRESLESYNNCLASCPPPEPADAPAEN